MVWYGVLTGRLLITFPCRCFKRKTYSYFNGVLTGRLLITFPCRCFKTKTYSYLINQKYKQYLWSIKQKRDLLSLLIPIVDYWSSFQIIRHSSNLMLRENKEIETFFVLCFKIVIAGLFHTLKNENVEFVFALFLLPTTTTQQLSKFRRCSPYRPLDVCLFVISQSKLIYK